MPENSSRVARTCGLPPGPHVLDDVLLEFHLSRPGPSSHRIAALLDPVAGRPELLRTVRTHLAQHQDASPRLCWGCTPTPSTTASPGSPS
ncbi:hypothetical protein OH786_26695 [Streptomyces atratus]|uniref:hypothetical protein n=1 Tax=Streptomyces atratus TaxID=1893 RepID=UPI00210EC707|nr:hypothetical protein [Streptomyces atratus]